MKTNLSTKTKGLTWREIKQRKRKWKEERTIKKLEKMQKEEMGEEEVEVKSDCKPCELITMSIAVPGSILQNAQSNELRAYVAGQIARAACIYKINEVIVFDDAEEEPLASNEKSLVKCSKYCLQFGRLLQYLECPQYLRKYFFPLHSDLQYAGIMNPLDAPHHLRQDENNDFREGVTLDKPVKNDKGTFVEVGLTKQVLVYKHLQPGLRVTVKLNPPKENSKKLKGEIVSPNFPLLDSNLYWGYTVRIAHSISEVFLNCPYKGGYDLSIGTSDKGKNIDEIKKKDLRNFKHGLIVFGGLQGLENIVEKDTTLNVENVAHLFDFYINTCPNQGSRTIRTEEAVFITLAELRKKCLKIINF